MRLHVEGVLTSFVVDAYGERYDDLQVRELDGTRL